MQTVVVFLSIASVLACPYDCAVKVAAAQAMRSDHKPACCKRCRTSETTEPTNNPTPESPAPVEDGRWCLCEGAVLCATARFSVDDSLQVSLWTWVSGTAETLDIATHLPSIDRAELPPPLDGRLTRIAMHSLLL